MKDVLDVNTSNTSSNISDVLKTGTMHSSVLKDVSMYCFHGRMYRMMYCRVLNQVSMYQVMYWGMYLYVLKKCMMYCWLYCRSKKDVLDVLIFSRMY